MSFSAKLFTALLQDNRAFCLGVADSFERQKDDIRALVCDALTLQKPLPVLGVPYRVAGTKRQGLVRMTLWTTRQPEEVERILSAIIGGGLEVALEQLAESPHPPQLPQVIHLESHDLSMPVVMKWYADHSPLLSMQQFMARTDKSDFERFLEMRIVPN